MITEDCEDFAERSPAPCRRLVVKVGTTTLTGESEGLDRAYMAELAAQLAEQRRARRQVVLVSSGAIRAGREALERAKEGRAAGPRPDSLPYKQAAAAVGQGLLMRAWTEAFSAHGTAVAQVLLTRDDLAGRHRFLNARNTLAALLSLGVVPIINENDTVAVDEIRFGDNDTLAARVAVLVEADLLLILSDVEGLYARPPGPSARNQGAAQAVISIVRTIDAEVERLAGGSSGPGTGGMRTKVEAARIATAAGIPTIIAQGRRAGVIADAVCGGDTGTTFLPAAGRPRGRKRWIASGSRARGSVTVNAGAREGLHARGASLLAVGITAVEGDFGAGDLIEVRDEDGRRFARGLVGYSSQDVRQIAGLRSEEMEAALGFAAPPEIIHRDNLVVEA